PSAPPAPPRPLGPMSRPELEPVVLAAPPFGATLRAEAPVAQGSKPRLAFLSATPNAVIDTDAWFRSNKLALPLWETPGVDRDSIAAAGPRPLPEAITLTYQGQEIREAIEVPDGSVAIHASPTLDRRRVVVRDALGDLVAAFDFEAYAHSPKDLPAERMFTDQEVRWALAQDGVLFVCTAHRTYAASSGGLNAFITALSLPSGELLWQSAPLVCNTRNFLLRDGWILTGYGFTAERDFLYVLDARTGTTVSKTKVKSGPDVILEQLGMLLVRTYDHDYVFMLR
ncbi:MAG: hypothetical protein KDK70_25760, partial [Myxococcales bacterium]|nr:hypothetical protein [Myxococcales bacterium]